MFQQESTGLDPPAEPRRRHSPVCQVVKVVGIHGCGRLRRSGRSLPAKTQYNFVLIYRWCVLVLDGTTVGEGARLLLVSFSSVRRHKKPTHQFILVRSLPAGLPLSISLWLQFYDAHGRFAIHNKSLVVWCLRPSLVRNLVEPDWYFCLIINTQATKV